MSRLKDADVLCKLIEEEFDGVCVYAVTSSEAISDFQWIVDIAPTVDAEPIRHAHWEVIDEAEPMRYGCSACHRLVWHTENYCPNCGAKMDEGKK